MFFRALLAPIALLPIAFGAQAQHQPPADIEIRAAYCISVLTGRSTDAQMRAALPGPRAQQQALREAGAGFDRDVRRLRSYLVPRMKYLDSEALLASADRGQADVNAFLQAQRTCEASCGLTAPATPEAAAKNAACFSVCTATDAAVERAKACSPVSWL